MAQQFRASVDLAEDPSLVPRLNIEQLTMDYNSSSRLSRHILWTLRAPAPKDTYLKNLKTRKEK